MASPASGRSAFDASAVLALLQDEPGAAKLLAQQAEAVVNAVNAAEVLAKLVGRGMPAAEAQAVFDALHLQVIPFDAELARLSARFGRRGVSLGDRCFLAAAEREGSGWTSDRGLAARAGARGPRLKYLR